MVVNQIKKFTPIWQAGTKARKMTAEDVYFFCLPFKSLWLALSPRPAPNEEAINGEEFWGSAKVCCCPDWKGFNSDEARTRENPDEWGEMGL